MQTDEGPVEGSSRSEYVTVPVKISTLHCDSKALSLFRCSSLFSSSLSDAHSQESEDSCSFLNDSPDRDTCTGKSVWLGMFSGVTSLDADTSGLLTTGYVSMDDLPKYSGDLRDYVPARLRCFSCKAPCCPLDTF